MENTAMAYIATEHAVMAVKVTVDVAMVPVRDSCYARMSVRRRTHNLCDSVDVGDQDFTNTSSDGEQIDKWEVYFFFGLTASTPSTASNVCTVMGFIVMD